MEIQKLQEKIKASISLEKYDFKTNQEYYDESGGKVFVSYFTNINIMVFKNIFEICLLIFDVVSLIIIVICGHSNLSIASDSAYYGDTLTLNNIGLGIEDVAQVILILLFHNRIIYHNFALIVLLTRDKLLLNNYLV